MSYSSVHLCQILIFLSLFRMNKIQAGIAPIRFPVFTSPSMTSPANTKNRGYIVPDLLTNEDSSFTRSRNIEFWRRAFEIFASYKRFQVQIKIKLLLAKVGIHYHIKEIDDYTIKVKNILDEDMNDETSSLWDGIHDLNSDRMVKLCLDLRGFYLKMGQFLGTRHDFMPTQYTTKLSKLHDDVTPLPETAISEILKEDLHTANLEDYFTEINLKSPLGSASIAQVHEGVWKQTKEKVAIKIQYPNAEYLMKGDLRNLRALAEFLQRTELKFDLLTCIVELQKRIKYEFDFSREANSLKYMVENLMPNVPHIQIPRPIFHSKRVLVMSYVPGENLGRLAEFRDKHNYLSTPKWIKQKFGRKLLEQLAQAWGYQIFVLKKFNADPHPGNIRIQGNNRLGLLDWGQVVTLSDKMLVKFALMNQALCTKDKEKIAKALINLGIVLKNPQDYNSAADIGITMLDTRNVDGYVINPFKPGNALKKNSVVKFPPDLYFLVRTVQLMRGISYGFGIDYSLADSWSPLAVKVLEDRKIKY